MRCSRILCAVSSAPQTGRLGKTWIAVLLLAVSVIAVIWALAGEPLYSGSPGGESGSVAEHATVLWVIDGDTIETSHGRVRLIGIDTPEREECGYDAAEALLQQYLPEGAAVTLVLPAGQNDTDRHGRLLRYVEDAQGTDMALAMLEAGFAVARYDSRDGYPTHPREESYHAAQSAELTSGGRVLAASCRSAG